MGTLYYVWEPGETDDYTTCVRKSTLRKMSFPPGTKIQGVLGQFDDVWDVGTMPDPKNPERVVADFSPLVYEMMLDKDGNPI